MAKSIWCDVGKKADLGAANEDVSPESGKRVEVVEDNPTKKRKINPDDKALPCLSSNEEPEEQEEDVQTDKATALDKPVGPVPGIKSVEKRIPSMTPKATNTLMTPKVTDTVDMPTISTSKRSHGRASGNDFLEAFQLSILQDRQQREHDRELREHNQQEQIEAREHNRKEQTNKQTSHQLENSQLPVKEAISGISEHE